MHASPRKRGKGHVLAFTFSTALFFFLLTTAVVLWNWPKFEHVSYFFHGKEMHTAELPLSVPTESDQLRVSVPLILGPFSPTSYSLQIDNCLNELFVNHVLAELPVICDYGKAVHVDLGRYLYTGRNMLEFSIRDDGGTGGVVIRPSVRDPLLWGYLIVLMALITTILITFWPYFGAFRFPAVVLAGGGLLRFWYMLATPLGVRGHDTEGHLDYVRYVLEHVGIPRTADGWEFYHPPLYYALGALWSTTVDFLIPSGLGFGSNLQVFSWFLSLISLGLLGWIGWMLLHDKAGRTHLALFLALCATLPSIVFFSAWVNNDVLLFPLSLLAFALLLHWREKPRMVTWLATSLVIALAILTKTNAIPLVAVAWLFLLLVRLSWHARTRLLLLSVATLVVLTGWFFAIKFVVEENRSIIGNLGNLHSGLLIPNTPISYLRFQPLFILQHPFHNPWDDAAGRQFLWETIFKSAFFGEFELEAARPLAVTTLALGLLVLLIAVVGMVQEARKHLRRSLPLFLTLAILLASMAAMRFHSPYASSEAFRYIPLTVVPLAYFAVRGASGLPRVLRVPAILTLMLFTLTNIAVTLAFTIQ